MLTLRSIAYRSMRFSTHWRSQSSRVQGWCGKCAAVALAVSAGIGMSFCEENQSEYNFKPRFSIEGKKVGVVSGSACVGEGVVKYDDGTIFDGNWIGYELDSGNFYFPNGDTYEIYCFGQPGMIGKINYAKGGLFAGSININTGLPDGFGTYSETGEGPTYIGDFKQGKFHGKGRVWLVNTEREEENVAEVFEGSFVDGLMDGLIAVRKDHESRELLRVETWEKGRCVEAQEIHAP